MIAAIGVMAGVMTLILREDASPVVSENPSPGSVLSVADPIISKILNRLRSCESGGKDEAINENDLDNTPSYGRYQFKPGTMYEWGTKMGILTNIESPEIMNVIMDGELQEMILVKKLEESWRNESFWMHQFPACGRIYRFWEYEEDINPPTKERSG